MPSINNLKELLVDELRDLHSAETQLVKALPRLAKAAAHEDLKEGISQHLEETKVHVERLEEALKILGGRPKGKTCHAMQGLVEESEEAVEADGPDAVRDANIIGAAQRVEHYEIAAYGTALAFANTLGESDVAGLLEETLDEEGATDKKLTSLAEHINLEAVGDEADGELGEEE